MNALKFCLVLAAMVTGNVVFAQPLQSKMIQLKTGVKLEYVESGDPHGIPVILLHGLTDSWHSYETVIPHLSTNRVFALTFRGHGNSDKPVDDYEVKTLAADVSEFMEKINLNSAVVVGFSMGGSVAQKFVIDYPQKTLGLVLIGSFASFTDQPAMLEFKKVIDQLSDPVDPKFITDFQRGTIAGYVPDRFFKTVCSESAKVPARVWKSVTTSFMKASYLDELRKTTKPVLVLWGDKDYLSPEAHQHMFAEQIPGAKLIIYRSAGHALHWEQPIRFAEDLRTFINERTINYSKLSDLIVQGLYESY